MTAETGWTLCVDATESEADAAAILDGLNAHNLDRAGPYGAQPLMVKAMAGGTLIGGMSAVTYWQWLHVRHLWVQESHRGGGVGSALVGAAEKAAAARGCVGAHLDTFRFQARGFYERLGYRVFGTLDDYPPGHSRYYMTKPLA